MSAPRRQRGTLSTSITATLATAGLVLGGLVTVVSPAVADDAAAPTSGALTWGVSTDLRTAAPADGTSRSADGGATFTADDRAQFPLSPAASGWDSSTSTGTLDFDGTIRLGSEASVLVGTVLVASPTITVNADGSGSLAGTTSLSGTESDQPEAVRTLASLDFAAVPAHSVEADGTSTLSWTDVPATLTAEGAAVLPSFSAEDDTTAPGVEGTALDPVTVSVTVPVAAIQPEAPLQTSTVLTVTPGEGVQEGDLVTLDAVVTSADPAATEATPEGTVQFLDSGSPLGDPVPATAAVLETDSLTAGEHSITAEFTPADQSWDASTSVAFAITVSAAEPTTEVTFPDAGDATSVDTGKSAPSASDPIPTTLTVTRSPSGTIHPGDVVRYTVKVSPVVPGQFRFSHYASTYDFQNSTTGVGTTAVTVDFEGEQPYAVNFVPTDSTTYQQSSADLTIVSTPNPAGAIGSFDWGFKSTWRSYMTSFSGATTATNGAVIQPDGTYSWPQADGSTYNTETGVGTIRYQGTIRYLMPSHGIDISLTDPRVIITADGSSWVSVEIRRVDGTTVSTKRTNFASLTIDGSRDPRTDSEGTTYWTAIQAVLSTAGSAAFSGSGGGYDPGTDLDSASFQYGVPAVDPVSPPSVNTSELKVAQGGRVVFTADNFAPGEKATATVHSTVVTVGTKTVRSTGSVKFAWRVPADFETGRHTITVTGASGSASATFTVVSAATEDIPVPETPTVTDTPGTTADQAEVCVARSVNGASLSWGIRESFRSYIVGPIAKGSVSLNGVSDNGAGWTWAGGTGTYNTEGGLGGAGFGGGVSMTGHAGLLEMTFANPSVQITGPGTAVLYIDINAKQLSGPDISQSGVAIATLNLAGGSNSSSADTIAFSGVPATLTASGAAAFAGFYEAGEALDPVSFTLPLGGAVACTGSSNPLAATGVDNVALLGGSAGVLVLLGLLLVFRQRRRNTAQAHA